MNAATGPTRSPTKKVGAAAATSKDVKKTEKKKTSAAPKGEKQPDVNVK